MQSVVKNFETRELKAPYASDWLLVLVVTALVLFGVLMVYSTTGVAAQEKFSDSFFLRKEATNCGADRLCLDAIAKPRKDRVA